MNWWIGALVALFVALFLDGLSASEGLAIILLWPFVLVVMLWKGTQELWERFT